MNALIVNKLVMAAVVIGCVAGCKKNKSDDDGEGPDKVPHRVFVAGIYDRTVCYWQNSDSIRTFLSEAQSGCANAIYVSGSTVYAAGFLTGPSYQPVYWIDGLKINLSTNSSGGDGFVTGMQVSGTDVTFSGYTRASGNDIPCIWKNGLRTDLSRLQGNRSGQATALVLSGADVYVAGYTEDLAGVKKACYWKNGQRTDLIGDTRQYGEAHAIAVADKKVYVAGFSKKNTDSAEVPCYWIEKGYNALSRSNDLFHGNVLGIYISGSDLYFAGYTDPDDRISAACYWKNGERTDLNYGGRASAYATGIQVLDNNVYVCGTTFTGPDAGIPCYWKDGNRIDLGEAGVDGSAWAIYVTK